MTLLSQITETLNQGIDRSAATRAHARDRDQAFGKQHNNVLRDMEAVGCSKEFRALNLEETTYAVADIS